MRFRSRHVHQSVFDFLVAELTVRGWVNDPVNFGTRPVTFVDHQPELAGEAVVLNTVALSIDEEGEDEHQQMGGGLLAVEYPTFVDIYGEGASIAVSIAQDVKQILRDRIIPLNDYSASMPVMVEGAYLEFGVVVVERPPAGIGANAAEMKRHWRVVKAQTLCFVPEGEDLAIVDFYGGY